MQNSDSDTATVLETNGRSAKVLINKSSSCNECGKAEAGICGKSGAGMIMETDNYISAEKGDVVEIALEKSVHIKAYFLAFAVPVIALFICAWLGDHFSRATGIQGLDAAGGFAGLTVSIIYSMRKLHKLDKSAKLFITRII